MKPTIVRTHPARRAPTSSARSASSASRPFTKRRAAPGLMRPVHAPDLPDGESRRQRDHDLVPAGRQPDDPRRAGGLPARRRPGRHHDVGVDRRHVRRAARRVGAGPRRGRRWSSTPASATSPISRRWTSRSGRRRFSAQGTVKSDRRLGQRPGRLRRRHRPPRRRHRRRRRRRGRRPAGRGGRGRPAGQRAGGQGTEDARAAAQAANWA